MSPFYKNNMPGNRRMNGITPKKIWANSVALSTAVPPCLVCTIFDLAQSQNKTKEKYISSVFVLTKTSINFDAPFSQNSEFQFFLI